MNMDGHINCMPIPIEGTEGIKHMAFDGCYYYFVVSCGQRILKTDLCFHIVTSFSSCRQYKCLCYDWKEHCFWASADTSSTHLYKLDCEMREIAVVALCGCLDPHSSITGLSFDCCGNDIVVSFHSTVVKANKVTGKCEKYCCIRSGEITSVLYLCPGCIIIVNKGEKQYIYVINPDGTTQKSCFDECGAAIESIFFNPCGESCDTSAITCLVTRWEGDSSLCRVPFCEWKLHFQICECNYEICGSCCCKPGPEPEPELNSCNDLIESIALVEAAISHILNAEGEKLQKVLAITDDFDKIMCVNKEINETIINVTSLEHVLYSKLMAASKICDCDDHWNCGCGNRVQSEE